MVIGNRQHHKKILPKPEVNLEVACLPANGVSRSSKVEKLCQKVLIYTIMDLLLNLSSALRVSPEDLSTISTPRNSVEGLR